MIETDDFRQMIVVMRNEINKFMSSKKFMVYIALVVLALALFTFLPYIVGDGLSGSAGDVFSSYMSFTSLMVILASTLFASYTIVSEFEERTALILFTRPIKKTTIFAGKFAACFVLEAVVIVAYYLIAMLVAFAVSGDIVSSILPSLAMALAYVFACSGIAMMISAFVKKGGTSAVVTFISILLILPIISVAMSGSGIDTWFMLDTASNSIMTSIPEYVTNYNQGLIEMGEILGIDTSGMTIEAANTVQSGLVMIAWGLASAFIAWMRFIRREF